MYECRECIYIHTIGSWQIRPMFIINSVMYAISIRTTPNKWNKMSRIGLPTMYVVCYVCILLSSHLNIRSSSFLLNEGQHPIIFHISSDAAEKHPEQRTNGTKNNSRHWNKHVESRMVAWQDRNDAHPTQVLCFWAGWKLFWPLSRLHRIRSAQAKPLAKRK